MRIRIEAGIRLAAPVLALITLLAPSPVAAQSSPPSNDNWASAVPLNDTAWETVKNEFATRQSGEPAHGTGGGRSVWYRYTPSTSRSVNLHTRGSDFDTVLAVYTGRSVDRLTRVALDEDGASDPRGTSAMTLSVSAGTTYHIAVDGSATAQGTVVLMLNYENPPNDFFHSSQVLEGASGSVSGTTSGATTEAGEPNQHLTGRSVWYRWTASSAGLVRLTPSDANLGIAVFRGGDFPTLARVAGAPVGEPLSFEAQQGVTYRIQALTGYTPSTFSLSWAPTQRPANDDFANASTVTGFKGSVSGTSFAATVEPGEPMHQFPTQTPSVWYRWTPTVGGSSGFSLTDGGRHTVVVYTGGSVDALTKVAEASNESVSFDAVEGTTYQIAVARRHDVAPSDFVLSFRRYAPDNDYFEDAIALPEISGSLSGDNVNATSEPSEPVHGGTGGGVSSWWQYRSITNEPITIDTHGSNFDTVLAVYVDPDPTGYGPIDLKEVASNDNAGGLQTSSVSFQGSRDVDYYVAVDGVGGEMGKITVNYAQTLGPPANDAFSAGTVLDGGSGRIWGHNYHATREPGEGSHYFDGSAGRSIWYRWTAQRDAAVEFVTDDSGFGSLMAAYTGSQLGELTPVAAASSIPDSPWYEMNNSRVRFRTRAGTTYWIAIDARLSQHPQELAGSLYLEWQEVVPNDPAPHPAAPGNDDFANASELVGRRGSVAGDTTGAGRQFWELPCDTDRTIWYRWTPASADEVTFRLTGSEIDAWAGVWLGYNVETLAYRGQTSPGYARGFGFRPVAGRTYHVAVCSPYEGRTLLSWEQHPPPPNDSFANARELTGDAGIVRGETYGATMQPGEPLIDPEQWQDSSVWFSWTAPSDGTYVFDGSGTFRGATGLFRGTSLGELERLDFSDGFWDSSPVLYFGATAGETFYISLASDSHRIPYTLRWHKVPDAPANDNLAHARILDGAEGTLKGNAAWATREAGEPSHHGFFRPRRSVWFRWTAPETGRMWVDTIGSDREVYLAAYSGGRMGDLVPLGRGARGVADFDSRLMIDVTAGESYLIALDAQWARTTMGHYALRWDSVSPTNDVPDDAIVLEGSGGTIDGDTLLSTKAADEPPISRSCSTSEESVWYRWVAPSSGAVTFSFETSHFYMSLGAYESPSGLPLACSPGNEDALGFTATAGKTYYLAASGGSGSFRLSWDMAPETIPPVVSLRAPTTGTTLSGLVQLSATAEDASGIERVEFLAQGHSVDEPTGSFSLLATDKTAPYEAIIDTKIFDDTLWGDRIDIVARAYDRSSNVALARSTVGIDNWTPSADLVDEVGPWETVLERSATFGFTSYKTAVFECSLDSAAFAPCASPVSYSNLELGRHTFRVRAIGSRGQTEPLFDSRRWEIASSPVTEWDPDHEGIERSNGIDPYVGPPPEPTPPPSPTPTPTPTETGGNTDGSTGGDTGGSSGGGGGGSGGSTGGGSTGGTAPSPSPSGAASPSPSVSPTPSPSPSRSGSPGPTPPPPDPDGGDPVCPDGACGTEGNDLIRVTDAHLTDGSFLVHAGAGDDTIEVHLSAVTVRGWSLEIDAGSGDDRVRVVVDDAAPTGSLAIDGGDGNDDMEVSFRGSTRLTAGPGRDLVTTGDGSDVIGGGAGRDVIATEAGADRIKAGSGADVVKAGAGRDYVVGQGGADLLAGGKDRDRVEGGGGDDRLRSRDGLDALDGGPGQDRCSRGSTVRSCEH